MKAKSALISTDGRGNLALGRQYAHALFRRTIKDDSGLILLEPQVPVPTSQAYFWTSRWQEGERRVEEALAEGHVHEDTASTLNTRLEKARRRG